MDDQKANAEKRLYEGMAAKQRAYGSELDRETAPRHGLLGGTLSSECDFSRPSLIDSVGNRLAKAQQESRNHVRLCELQSLLERNPDVARILDLIGIKLDF